mmetsp:Transcript_77766/g.166735  ORF Transcript_77766/g.166735 Transcript_77766/m.166735 type:complete len:592 (-) Transcript_77766:16-1791(-)
MPTPLSDSSPKLGRANSSNYWNASGWDPDSRVYIGANNGQTSHLIAVQPSTSPAANPTPVTASPLSQDAAVQRAQLFTPRQAVQTPVGSRPSLPRGNSSTYWDASGWDPDNRVYVGATNGQTNHLIAVQPSSSSAAKPQPAAISVSPTQNGVMKPAPQLPLNGQSPSNGQSSSNGPSPASSAPSPASRNYWGASAWDPDGRVYVGATSGQRNHLIAVQPSASSAAPPARSGPAALLAVSPSGAAPPGVSPLRRAGSSCVWDEGILGDSDAAPGDEILTRLWVGGLTARALSVDVGADAEPTLPLSQGGDGKRPGFTLQEWFDIDNKEIGAGGFGVVRAARHRDTGTKCVVKTVDKAAAGDRYGSHVEAGLYVRLLSMAEHPNVVRYFDALEGPEKYYVVMEQLCGAELLDQVEDAHPNAVAETYSQGAMRQMLAALAHIHDTARIYHRDVKLSNFRFRSVGSMELVLLDFGFASFLDEPWDRVVCGTTSFMAPEVLARAVEQPHMAAVDLWGMGVILYTLLTGSMPFEEEEVRSLGPRGQGQQLLERAFQANELAPYCWAGGAVDLLRSLLNLDPAARFTAAKALTHPWFD